MTQQICSNTEEGDTATLKDSRDPNSYTIVKLEDGNCWMQQNLRLTGGITLTDKDSNVTSDWPMPASLTNLSKTNFSSSDYYKAESYYKSSTLYTDGVYYSFTAATAGAATEDVTSGEVGGATGNSICPKGWMLPTSSEYRNMLTKAGISNSSDGSTKINGDKYKFPYAGYTYMGSLNAVNSTGYYWSRTISDSKRAIHMFLSSSSVYMGGSSRSDGYSVRCVVKNIENPLFTTSDKTSVNVSVPSILTIDAVSGLAETADASKIIEGTAAATISSNTEYNVTLHSAQPSLKDPTVTTSEISPVSSSNPVQPGNNSWGFWDGASNPKSYTLPITTEPQSFYNTLEDVTLESGDPAKKHTYYVGISISPSLPSGTYATDVIITASAK